MKDLIKIPCNKNSQQCVRNVMSFLADISGDKIVTGQHTQTMEMEELHHIRRAAGKEPALLGFELLSYSPNINYLDTDDECMTEVKNNLGTLRRAWEWADKKGLITFTWHWFSPLGGRSKSFFTENTDFDAERAAISGTEENKALLSDIDVMAGILRPFCKKEIPILWRPFHEGEGKWFWWGAKGGEPLKKLYRTMYRRFTETHGLNNLIWVWNATLRECYPGDDVVDIVSRDMYPEKHCHTSQSDMYYDMRKITECPKIILIGETGTLPDPKAVHDEKVGWASYMTWSGDFCMSEEFSTSDKLREVYSSPFSITKETLPMLY